MWGILLEPLLSLVELVRGHKVAVDELPLHNLSLACANYVKSNSTASLDGMGDVAATLAGLILSKSRELTPWLTTAEFEELTLARSRDQEAISPYGHGMLELQGRHSNGLESFSRPDHVAAVDRIDVTVPLSPALLQRALSDQLERARVRSQAKLPPPIFLRIEMAIHSLQDSLRHLRGLTLHTLIRRQSLDRRDAVVYFLAILDLTRKGLIRAEQDRPFEDIRLAGVHAISDSGAVAS